MKAREHASVNVHNTALSMMPSGRCKVLDAGAGEGALSARLIDAGHDVKAVDIEPKSFGIKGVKCKKADLNDRIPYPDSSFDVVMCVEVIEHLENPWQLIREINRVLKKNGTAIISTPNNHNWYSRIYFLVFSRLLNCNDPRHIAPIFIRGMTRMCDGLFKIVQARFNRALIPLLRISFPTSSWLLGDIVILKLKKI